MTVRLRIPLIVAVVTLVALSACSSSSHSSAPSANGASTTTSTTAVPRPSGPVPTITGPITAGKGISLISSTAIDLNAAHYKQNEYFAAGTAQSFTANGSLGADGMWSVKPASSAPYKTRFVVRTPSDPSKFSGNVLVEWMNVSGGVEIPPDFSFAGNAIMRAGDAWVGVSAQRLGIDGGTGIVQPSGSAPSGGLRGSDPARYGSLRHPGDTYALDIFSQVGRALRTPGTVDPLGGLKPQHIIAIGESQSAFELTTYIDALQPVTHVFDGFFVHSRSGSASPLAGGVGKALGGGVHIRTDIDVPVLMLETETDETFLQYFTARQPDTDHIRLWDVAGASHADAYLVGGSASALGCKTLINSAPTHFVVDAALAALDKWVDTGTPPPSAPRMDVKLENGSPVVQRDARGIAIGGIRTGAITVPVAAYSGAAQPGSVLCALFGSTTPFDAATIASLYKNKADYSAKYARATDDVIRAGYILMAERDDAIADGVKRFP